jgi:LPXTG-site transpeptidase (sortase) family protein
VFTEGSSLLMKVGVIMLALALALVIAAVVVSVTVGSEPERVAAAEVAAKSPGQAPRYSSGQEGSAIRKPSSKEQSPRYPPGRQSLGYDSSSGGSVLHKEAKPPRSQSPTPQLADQQTPSRAPSDPESHPQQHQLHQQVQPLPDSVGRRWSELTQRELKIANAERHYELLAGAIMSLTIEAIGIIDVPVFDSDSQWALANGVAHHSQTSLPWSPTAQRNVYLAGHRMGYRGSWSRMIFYNLHKLGRGDEVVLKDGAGRSYRYRVREVFITDPKEVWVMGQVRGRDMVTLQTCTPIPTFQKRLIVRADRV